MWTAALVVTICSAGSAPAGTLLVANKSNNTLSVFQTPRFEEVATLPTGDGPHEVEVDSTGTFAAVSNYHEEDRGSLTVVDLRDLSSRVVDLDGHTGVHGIAWLPSAERIAATSESSDSVLVIDVPRGEVVATIPVGGESPHMLVVDRAGRFAWTANVGSGSVSKIDLVQEKSVATRATGDGAEGIALSADESQLWVSNRGDGTVQVLDPIDLRELADLEIGGMPIRVELAKEGRLALVTSAVGGKITTVVAKSFEVVGEVSTRGETNWSTGRFASGLFGLLPVPVGAQLSLDGESFYVANSFGGVVVEYGLDDLEVRRRIIAGQEPDGMAVSPLDVPRQFRPEGESLGHSRR